MDKDSGIFERRHVASGALIVKEGEPANCAYLIQSGKVAVFTETDDRLIELARLGVGEIFGEMALASNSPRSASVKALEDCNLIVITSEVLHGKLSRSDSTVQAIFKMLVQRMARANKAVINKKSSADELIGTARDAYNSVHEALPASQQKVFEQGVGEHFEAFLSAMSTFNERYSK